MDKSKCIAEVNKVAEEWNRIIQSAICGKHMCGCKKLRNCSAVVREYVVDIDRFSNLDDKERILHVYVLQSYETDVAYIIENFNVGIDVLRLVYGYTNTSSQHIRKFFDDYIDKTRLSTVLTYR